MIISFARFTDAVLEGRKTVTRRDWPDSHAIKFPVGHIALAYDRQPMYGGILVARIEILSIEREPIGELLADPEGYGRAELVREGDFWDDVHEFAALFAQLKWGDPFRIEFRLVERLSERRAKSRSKRSPRARQLYFRA